MPIVSSLFLDSYSSIFASLLIRDNVCELANARDEFDKSDLNKKMKKPSVAQRLRRVSV